eukprot:m.370250 g.370250  ORF g.370250 m.370250 type:complete len:90 (+) comp56123_c1_seq16:215-484(+)
MVAAYTGGLASVRTLVEAGASTASRDKFGKTALDYARERKRTQVVALLEEHEGRLSAQQNIKPAQREPVQPALPEQPTCACRFSDLFSF